MPDACSLPVSVHAGCAYLGNVYLNGEGVKADAVQAVSWYQKACAGGYTEACASARK
ncbi:SEL1-like repeat protein [Archangium sp.]|uniref:SEL1-like repeat protein n=1 Tax=Archangium sp. TaxID=1872627 RepID=UPI00389A0DC5